MAAISSEVAMGRRMNTRDGLRLTDAASDSSWGSGCCGTGRNAGWCPAVHPFRRRVVLRAYDERCAITGLKLINGGGRAEAEAAHIRPVEANGPDSVQNGIALSGTVHWMFDRGLISLSDDLDIMISRQANDTDSISGLINRSGRANLPLRPIDRPHPHFLAWHRENVFKQ